MRRSIKQGGEAALLDLIEKRYPEPEFLFLRHVSSGPGANDRRFADGLAVNKWATRGLTIQGFEVKCARSDWLRELRTPAKAEGLGGYCDFWWLVTSSVEVARPGELPQGWGLLSVNNKGELRQQVKAEKLKHTKPVDRRFMVAVTNALQRAVEEATRKRIGQLVEPREAAYEEGYQDGKRHAEEGLVQANAQSEALIKSFEQASGLKLESYTAGRLGNLMRLLMKSGPGELQGQYEEMARRARVLTGTLEAVLQELQAYEKRRAEGGEREVEQNATVGPGSGA